jgi:DNA-binding NtrC family response regulator
MNGKTCHRGADPQKLATVLLVSPFEEDHAALRAILHRSEWLVSGAKGILEAMTILAGQPPIPVVICERDLPMGDWTALLESMQLLSCPPHLIVSSRQADNRLWAEVLNLGGYDVLATPFDRAEVLRTVQLARLNWARKWESIAILSRSVRVF